MRKNQTISEDPLTINCEECTTDIASYVCEACKTAICMNCIKNHEGHRCLSFEEIPKELVDKVDATSLLVSNNSGILEKQLQQLRSLLNNTRMRLKELSGAYDKAYGEKENKIKHAISEIQSSLEAAIDFGNRLKGSKKQLMRDTEFLSQKKKLMENSTSTIKRMVEDLKKLLEIENNSLKAFPKSFNDIEREIMALANEIKEQLASKGQVPYQIAESHYVAPQIPSKESLPALKKEPSEEMKELEELTKVVSEQQERLTLVLSKSSSIEKEAVEGLKKIKSFRPDRKGEFDPFSSLTSKLSCNSCRKALEGYVAYMCISCKQMFLCEDCEKNGHEHELLAFVGVKKGVDTKANSLAKIKEPIKGVLSCEWVSYSVNKNIEAKPGQKISASVMVKNNGTIPWPSGTRLNQTASSSITYNAPVLGATKIGETKEIAIDLVAQNEEGKDSVLFQLMLPTGESFGPLLWFNIIVKLDKRSNPIEIKKEVKKEEKKIANPKPAPRPAPLPAPSSAIPPEYEANVNTLKEMMPGRNPEELLTALKAHQNNIQNAFESLF